SSLSIFFGTPSGSQYLSPTTLYINSMVCLSSSTYASINLSSLSNLSISASEYFGNMLFISFTSFKMGYNVDVYELWRVSAQTYPDINWLWKIRRIFQVWTDQAIAYIRCWQLF